VKWDKIFKTVGFYTQVAAGLLLWIKFFYYLRIYNPTSYLIRIVVSVLADMVTFLGVLLVVVLAFSDTFYTLSNYYANGDGDFEEGTAEPFVGSYSEAFMLAYRFALGDFEGFEPNSSYVAYILFLISTLFALIVMLNLLIAIISDSYARVVEVQDQFALKEKAQVITDVREFKFLKYFTKQCDPETLLFLAIEKTPKLDKDESVTIYEIKSEIENIQRQIDELPDKVLSQISQSQVTQLVTPAGQ